MVTRRPRDFSRLPRLEAVSPLPSEEATPPVTNTCLVGWLDTKGAPVGVIAVVRIRLTRGLVQYISTGFDPIKNSAPPSDDAPGRTPADRGSGSGGPAWDDTVGGVHRAVLADGAASARRERQDPDQLADRRLGA